MTLIILLVVGLLAGVTTVLFGFGGGFITVPVITISDGHLGADALRVATATSALVMLVNAVVATAATRRVVLRRLSGRTWLFVLLSLGGALGAAISRFAPDVLLRWGFVLYVLLSAADLIARPGFLRGAEIAPSGTTRLSGMPTWSGLPIGSVASFLGVGGSVITVPLMRRAGAPMPVAAALANPITLTIVAPALLVSLLASPSLPANVGLVGSVDVLSASALLLTSIPVVILLRRRPPRIPDSAHAWTYLALLIAAGLSVAFAG